MKLPYVFLSVFLMFSIKSAQANGIYSNDAHTVNVCLSIFNSTDLLILPYVETVVEQEFPNVERAYMTILAHRSQIFLNPELMQPSPSNLWPMQAHPTTFLSQSRDTRPIDMVMFSWLMQMGNEKYPDTPLFPERGLLAFHRDSLKEAKNRLKMLFAQYYQRLVTSLEIKRQIQISNH